MPLAVILLLGGIVRYDKFITYYFFSHFLSYKILKDSAKYLLIIITTRDTYYRSYKLIVVWGGGHLPTQQKSKSLFGYDGSLLLPH